MALGVGALAGVLFAGQGTVPAPEWFVAEELAPTYTEGAGLVYEMRCVPCHRVGGIVEMDLSSHRAINRWAVGTTVPPKDAVLQGMMPPWPPDPAVGSFDNDRRMSSEEKALVADFIDAGYPRGPGEFEPRREWVDGWTIAAPDVVFDLPIHELARDAEADMRDFVVTTDFPEDRWLAAVEVQPGDAYAVALIDAGPLGAFASANWRVAYPVETARLLKAGAEIPIKVLYRKRAGTASSVETRIGLRFVDDPALVVDGILDAPLTADPFELEAEQAGIEVRARFEFPAAGRVHSIMPVMHERGARVAVNVVHVDGRVEPLLSIPTWDPKWKFRYRLSEPLAVPAGTVVEVVGLFDNSLDNIKNPDPWSDVSSGPMGETLQGWVEYSLDGAR